MIQKHTLKSHKKIILKYLTISYTLLIIILFLAPVPNIKPSFNFFEFDKLIHILIYIFLVLFWGLYLIESNFSLKQILLIIIIFGLIIEILQYILPFGRYFDFVDFIANSVGAIIGAFILLFYKKKLL